MIIELVMPRAGLTMVEGTISSWMAKEGAKVCKGDAIMEFENEKNTIEFNCNDEGYLHITAQEGETVAVGAPIAVLASTLEEYQSLATKLLSPPQRPQQKLLRRQLPLPSRLLPPPPLPLPLLLLPPLAEYPLPDLQRR